MSISDSRRLAVLKHLQTTLQGMTDAGVYHYPVTNPDSVSLDPTRNLLTELKDLPMFNIEATAEGSKPYYPMEQLREIFRVNIIARANCDESNPIDRVTVAEHLPADLELALQADTTRGGLAVDTRLLVPQSFVGIGSPAVIVIQPIEIRLYRQYRDGV